MGTYRPADVAVSEHVLARAVRTLQARRHCVELPLHDLNAAAVRSYLAMRFPGADFPAALARLIHAHTGGHPLFVVAIVDHMLSRGWILDTAPGWALSTPPETIELGMPDDVRRTIETQLHRLSPSERGLLEAASVAGDITAPVLAAALALPRSAPPSCTASAGSHAPVPAGGRQDRMARRRVAATLHLHARALPAGRLRGDPRGAMRPAAPDASARPSTPRRRAGDGDRAASWRLTFSAAGSGACAALPDRRRRAGATASASRSDRLSRAGAPPVPAAGGCERNNAGPNCNCAGRSDVRSAPRPLARQSVRRANAGGGLRVIQRYPRHSRAE